MSGGAGWCLLPGVMISWMCVFEQGGAMTRQTRQGKARKERDLRGGGVREKERASGRREGGLDEVSLVWRPPSLTDRETG